jgi:hypothetical protein
MDTPEDKQTDHINHNGLDNRRANLRNCTRSENQCNQRKRKGCTSKYRGVYWYKPYGKWMVRIELHDYQMFIGYYINEEDAARAFNDAAIRLHGEFANLNEV